MVSEVSQTYNAKTSSNPSDVSMQYYRRHVKLSVKIAINKTNLKTEHTSCNQ